jgi:hypothetical protein
MTAAQKNARKRTPEEIKYDGMREEANRANRLFDRMKKVSDAADKSMRVEMAHEAEKAGRRQLSEDMQDFVFGRDTGGARRVRERLQQVASVREQVNIVRAQQTISAPKNRSERKKFRRQKEGRFQQFFTPDGHKVKVDLKSNPLISVYRNGEITAPQFAAAAQFQRDFEVAGHSGMKSASLEPGVDGGQIAAANLRAVDTQARLSKLKAYVGNELYMILQAVVGYGLTFSEIHAAGAEHNRVLSAKLRTALNKSAVFYSFQDRESESGTMKALQRLLQGMAAAAGEFTA